MKLGFRKASIRETCNLNSMAGGRYGAYRDREFRDWEDDTSRRKEYYSKEGFSRQLGRDFDSERAVDRRGSGRTRIRHHDVKELDTANGKANSSSSTSNSGDSEKGRPRRPHCSGKSDDREPGELSSGSGSDVHDYRDSHVGDRHCTRPEATALVETEKKRKFSPIIWDKEEKHKKSLLKPTFGLSASSPLPHASSKSSPRPHDAIRSTIGRNIKAETSLSETEVTPQSINSTDLGLSAGLYPKPLQKQDDDIEDDTRPSEDEEYVSSRNISASRWAGENDSPRDEGEVADEQTKAIPATEFAVSKVHKKASSPELGEVTVDTPEGAQSSGSQTTRCSSGPLSENDAELNSCDKMEIDKPDEDDMCHHDITDLDVKETGSSPEKPEPVAPIQRNINMLQGCRSVDEFEKLNKIDEGTYGVVYRAQNRKTGEIVALKKVKMEKEREGFPLTSLREINILLSLHHPSIVDVKEVVVGGSLDHIFMVMEYMDHDLKGLMEAMKQPFTQSEVKCLMLQLLEGVKYLHDNWVLHRDLKTSNLLLNNRGELKICDFGLARQYGSPLKPYTHLVVTLWYRAPELLLGAKEYSTAIDMWSLGCIMAELLAKEPLFNGKSEIDQLDKIFKVLGTPNEKIWPGYVKLPGVRVNFTRQPYNKLREKFPPTSFSGRPTLSEAGFDLLNKLLTYDPEKRITAEAALDHYWFREVPLPKSKEFMPTFPAQHAQDRRLRRIMKRPDHVEEQRRKELQQGMLIGTGGLFS